MTVVNGGAALGLRASGADALARGVRQAQDASGPDTLSLVIAGLVVLLAVGVRLALNLGRRGGTATGDAIDDFGFAGGAVCPNCGRAFARSVLAPNLLMGKLCRCPHCGKWSVRPRATEAELAAASATMQRPDAVAPAETLEPAERLLRDVEQSRYQDPNTL